MVTMTVIVYDEIFWKKEDLFLKICVLYYVITVYYEL